MTIKKLYHCDYCLDTPAGIKDYFAGRLRLNGQGARNLDKLLAQAASTGSNKIIMVRGATMIAGYLMVIQALTKQYPDIEVLMVGANLSFYGVK